MEVVTSSLIDERVRATDELVARLQDDYTTLQHEIQSVRETRYIHDHGYNSTAVPPLHVTAI